ncbi:hypothetical protein GGS23DRAFT_598410 [Durotheca rogersii]|uniref:uncharacterized protein n=1 Tax=Durotheca rogersii TaxID=419775 RepID=UPI00221EA103|nr:uncharacterized protein GGS23DRAFT_598410 [Durotheca rogersii]KAI5861634.1 hypothetical protein GGS23DRAFT_598410 [Durotheca rogersii]
MFGELIEACRRLEKAEPPPSPELPDDVPQLIPDGITAKSYSKLSVSTAAAQDSIAVLWAAYATVSKLGADAGDGKIDCDADALNDIADRIADIVLPVCTGASADEDTTDYGVLQRKGELGLRILTRLVDLPGPSHPLSLRSPTLLCIAAFTDAADAWTTDASCTLASALLLPLTSPEHRYCQAGQLANFIADTVLTGFLRPLFSRSRPAGITSTGRRDAYADRDGEGRYDDTHLGRETADVKPWKYARRYAVAVFSWAVRHADATLLQTKWPLFTPPLLTLLDEPASSPSATTTSSSLSFTEVLKPRALGLLRTFWARCPPDLMADDGGKGTGLAPVFEAAVFPTLLSLPALTPEPESLRLLGAAYPALLEMAGVAADLDYDPARAAPARGEAAGDRRAQEGGAKTRRIRPAQRALLGRVVRDGVMVGWHHAPEHARLAALFCETLRCVVDGLGVYAVKHLKARTRKLSLFSLLVHLTFFQLCISLVMYSLPIPNDIIPMISTILSDPFGPQHPPSLLTAARLLRAVLRACWPRVPRYCNDIVKALALCWLNLEDQQDPIASRSDIEIELAAAANMLQAVMKAVARDDMDARVTPLIETEPRLGKLFARDVGNPT